MARPGLRNHVKFKRAQRILDIPAPHLIGHLECLWATCYECGDPVVGDQESIEAAAEWVGKAGELFEALLTCGGKGSVGFIEPVPGDPERFQVHDLFDHAPEYVKKRQQREQARKQSRDNSDSSVSDRSAVGQCPPVSDNVGQRRTVAENGQTPSTQHPAPAPSTQLFDQSARESENATNPPSKRLTAIRRHAGELFAKMQFSGDRADKGAKLVWQVAALVERGDVAPGVAIDAAGAPPGRTEGYPKNPVAYFRQVLTRSVGKEKLDTLVKSVRLPKGYALEPQPPPDDPLGKMLTETAAATAVEVCDDA